MVAVCVCGATAITVKISTVLCCGGSMHTGVQRPSLKGIEPLYWSAYYNGPDLAHIQSGTVLWLCIGVHQHS